MRPPAVAANSGEHDVRQILVLRERFSLGHARTAPRQLDRLVHLPIGQGAERANDGSLDGRRPSRSTRRLFHDDAGLDVEILRFTPKDSLPEPGHLESRVRAW